jgi:hypothetical protein
MNMTYPVHLAPYVVHKNDPALLAFYMLNIMRLHKLVVVLDDDGKAVGVIGETNYGDDSLRGFINPEQLEGKTAFDICTQKFTSININVENIYKEAGYIYDTRNIKNIPVLDEDGRLFDLLSLWQWRFRETYDQKQLPQKHYYAKAIMDAAKLSKQKGIKNFSVLEFGVSSGNGLLCAELYSAEIGRIFDINIDVFGFDNCTGLTDKLTIIEKGVWGQNDFFVTDIDHLKSRFKKAKMYIGDIAETKDQFINDNNLPIGVMLCDVDQYESCCSVLKILDNEEKYFLPEIQIYFDDLKRELDFSGEQRAIIEFNQSHSDIKIVPEKDDVGYAYIAEMGFSEADRRIKKVLRLSNPDFAKKRETPFYIGEVN